MVRIYDCLTSAIGLCSAGKLMQHLQHQHTTTILIYIIIRKSTLTSWRGLGKVSWGNRQCSIRRHSPLIAGSAGAEGRLAYHRYSPSRLLVQTQYDDYWPRQARGEAGDRVSGFSSPAYVGCYRNLCPAFSPPTCRHALPVAMYPNLSPLWGWASAEISPSNPHHHCA